MRLRTTALMLVLTSLGAATAGTSVRADFKFLGCTDDQSEVVLYAYGLAFGRAKAAENRVGSNSTYTRWFGTWSDRRGGIVRRKIHDMIATSLIGTPSFTCLTSDDFPCQDEEIMAFVYKNTSYEIYLCPIFWSNKKRLGYDMTSVILHEIAHFEIGAGGVKLDHCLGFGGTKACERLARDDPDFAVESADNYRLFIEDGAPSNAELWDLPPPPGFN